MRHLLSLVVALGKDGNAYLLNRDNLGGHYRALWRQLRLMPPFKPDSSRQRHLSN